MAKIKNKTMTRVFGIQLARPWLIYVMLVAAYVLARVSFFLGQKFIPATHQRGAIALALAITSLASVYFGILLLLRILKQRKDSYLIYGIAALPLVVILIGLGLAIILLKFVAQT